MLDQKSVKYDYSVVLPCLNEELTLLECITEARQGAELFGLTAEIIVADNGSTDNSKQIAESNGAKVVEVPTRGYGAALNAGILAASTEYVLMGDSDCSYSFVEGVDLIQILRNENKDIVMGNRFLGGIEKNAMPLHHQYLGNPVLSFLGRKFFRIPIGDFHCGLRAVRKSAYEKVAPTTTGMEFATEMIARLANDNASFAEWPVRLRKDKRDRRPHLRSFPDGWRHLKMMLLFSPQYFLLVPGLFGLIIGSIGLTQYSIFGEINFILGAGRIQAALFYFMIYLSGLQLFAASVVSLATAELKKIKRFQSWDRTKKIVVSKRFFSLSVCMSLIGLTMLIVIGSDWLASNQPSTNPLIETRKTLAAIAFAVTGTTCSMLSIQVRQVLSKFW